MPPAPIHQCKTSLVIRLAVENAQDSKEQVEDIEVQADGSCDLLLDVVLAEHELGVNQDVAAENQSRNASVDELAGAGLREEHVHEAEEHQSPERAEKIRHPAREVVLGLAGEGGQEDEDSAGQKDGVQHDRGLVEGDDDGDGVGLEKGEAREKEKVGRVRVALPVSEEEEDYGSDHLYDAALAVWRGNELYGGRVYAPKSKPGRGFAGSSFCSRRS